MEKLSKKEDRIVRAVKPHLLRCRPGDWNHAKRVASWARKLGPSENNLELIVVASYIHDIGWRDLVSENKISLDHLKKLEQKANDNSEPFAREVLEELGYSEKDMQTVFRLIGSADTREASQSDEEVIIDSDALSKLDIDHLKEKFPRSDWMKLWKMWEKRLAENIRTEKAKDLYPDLLKQLKKDIDLELQTN